MHAVEGNMLNIARRRETEAGSLKSKSVAGADLLTNRTMACHVYRHRRYGAKTKNGPGTPVGEMT